VSTVRGLQQWLADYGESHRHPVNEALHYLCVPAIVLSLAGLLASIPLPPALAAEGPWLNWGTLAALGALGYYLRLSPALAGAAAIAFLVMFLALAALARLPWPLWQTCAVIFAVAWAGQFIGHAIEGRRPSFFKDLQFLLIGPLWLLAGLYGALARSRREASSKT
jgi:uncharacterized membrane protein YGL010W